MALLGSPGIRLRHRPGFTRIPGSLAQPGPGLWCVLALLGDSGYPALAPSGLFQGYSRATGLTMQDRRFLAKLVEKCETLSKRELTKSMMRAEKKMLSLRELSKQHMIRDTFTDRFGHENKIVVKFEPRFHSKYKWLIPTVKVASRITPAAGGKTVTVFFDMDCISRDGTAEGNKQALNLTSVSGQIGARRGNVDGSGHVSRSLCPAATSILFV